MGSITKIYLIKELNDKDNFIENCDLIIFRGDGNRIWFESKFISTIIEPIGRIKTVIPENREDKNMFLDACIVFFPKAFEKCPTLKIIQKKLKNKEFLDFNLDRNKLPMKEWEQLREEARPYFKKLYIFEAKLKNIRL